MSEQRIVAVVDIGTASCKAVVAEVADDGLHILGVGQGKTLGARGGRVLNVDLTAQSIVLAVTRAEAMSGIEVGAIYVCLSGGFLRAANRRGMAPVRRGIVGQWELDEVRRTAIALPLNADEQVQAVVPQGYMVDHTQGVSHPRGMAGACLYGRYHVVIGSEQAASNARRACEKLDLEVAGVHLSAFASAHGVLDPDERDLGVVVVDVGASTTSVAVYVEGVLEHTGIIPLGGAQLVSDLAHGLKAPAGEAERLLEARGCVDESCVEPGESFDVAGLGGRPPRRLAREVMVEFLQPRAEDILAAVARELERGDIDPDSIAGGIVLTGGVAALDGLPELAELCLRLPARRGTPRDVGGLTKVVQRPGFAAAVGLARQAAESDGGVGSRPRKGLVVRWWHRLREMADVYG